MSVPPYQQPPPGGYYPPPPKKSSPWPWILGLGCGIPTVLIVGCVAFGARMVTQVANDPEVKKEIQKLKTNTIRDKVAYDPDTFQMKPASDGSGQEITGVVKNKTAEAIPYIIVRFGVFDKDGRQVGTAIATGNKIAPKAEWKFRAEVRSDEAKSFKFADITNAPLDLLNK